MFLCFGNLMIIYIGSFITCVYNTYLSYVLKKDQKDQKDQNRYTDISHENIIDVI